MDSCSTTSSTLKKDEQARIKIKNILVKIESGVGNNTIPLLLLESSLDCNISDFYNNKRMTLIGNLSVQMAYYNAKLALWEPVIEPIVTEYKPNGSVVTKRWDMKVTLQQNSNSDLNSAVVSPNFDETDAFVTTELQPPLMVWSLISTESLEITVTKTLVNVLQNLASSFEESMSSIKRDNEAPIIVQNRLGKNIAVHLEHKEFKYFKFGEKPGPPGQCLEVQHDQDIQLGLYRDRRKEMNENSYVSPLQVSTIYFRERNHKGQT